MAWQTFTKADVIAVLSPVARQNLSNYIALNSGADPLDEIVPRVIQSTRLAIASYKGNVMGPAGTVPLSCMRHAVNLCLGDLQFNVTIGNTLTVRQAAEKAEIFLRSLPYGNPRVEHPDSEDGTFIEAAPSYTAPDVSTQRTVFPL